MKNLPFLGIENQDRFNDLAIETFRYQAQNNPIYRKYLDLLSSDPEAINSIHNIPFLPIEFFKTQKVYSCEKKEEKKFYSSGTTGMQASIHYLAHLDWYIESFLKAFNIVYGSPDEYCFLALLPSYLERSNSSLVFMMDKLIRKSKHAESGFYLNNLQELSTTLKSLEKRKVPTILFGVSYALLDLADNYPQPLLNTTIIETGGMKGKREELSRDMLHKKLASAFEVETIHSEYGMTELLSQAYSTGGGLFNTPPWMKILIRDPYDPFSYLNNGRTGGINIIDLANRFSCSFIETQDLGKLHKDQSFEVLGRFDNSDMRGCNLLVQ